MFFDNGDFLIFAPPDLSVALFLDTAYDKEVYDQKIVESYAADGDGRGDVISRDDIPVLMGGALPFTNMQNLLSENHDDGTYRYEDITEDISTPSAGRGTAISLNSPTPPTGSTTWGTGRRS